MTISKLLSKGISPMGLHVMTDAYVDDFKPRHLIGTVRAIEQEPGVLGYSPIVICSFFSGEPWPVKPLAHRVTLI